MVTVCIVLVVDEQPLHLVTLTVTGLLGGAMGSQAGAARRVAVKDVTTVVVALGAVLTLIVAGVGNWDNRVRAGG